MHSETAKMSDTTAVPQSDEWVKTLCAVIQKELASIDDRSLCNADTEADLCRRFINPASNQSQESRAKFEIFSAVSQRRRDLVTRDVSEMMHGLLDDFFISTENAREVTIDSAVDMAMTGFVCDHIDGRILNSNASQKLAEIDKLNERREALVPWMDHEAERTELQSKIDKLKSELLSMGTLVKERSTLVNILVEFLDEFHAVGPEWSPVLEEHDLLKPVARYIHEHNVHNSFTTKFMLLQMIDMMSRPTHTFLKKCKKRFLFEPSAMLFIASLCFFAVFQANFKGIQADALWLVWVVFFGWSVLRYYDCVRATMIRKRLGVLVENFKWIKEPITCDGEEMATTLRKIQRLGLDVPSIMYPLMRILVPGAKGLY